MNKTRSYVIFIIVALFFGAIVFKLVNIQLVQHENYKFLAERQQKKTQEVVAERGRITDSKGEVLAYTIKAQSFYVYKKNLTEKAQKKLVTAFASTFKKPASYYNDIIAKAKGEFCIERKVPKEIADKLKDLVIDGLTIRDDNIRVYPYQNLASHIIGYVNNNFSGITGIERVCENYLSGINGQLLIERDVIGRTVTIDDEKSVSAKDGYNVELTINKTFQKILEDELKVGVENYEAVAATGVLMDPKTGEILALANYPDYNIQKFSSYGEFERKNRVITDSFEPGSTLKSIILASLIEEKKTRPLELINTESGKYKLNGVLIRDEHSHTSLTVNEILEQSSNIGMAKLSERVDANTVYKYLRDFGFGNYTTIELPGEVVGRLNKPSMFDKTTKASLSRGYAINVTPIQLVTAYSALVNGGNLYKPQIIKAIKDRQNNIISKMDNKLVRRIISETTSETIKNMMMGVVENGTGRMARLDDVTVGGKTGTAKKIVNKKYTSDAYNSSFVGFFPVEDPKVVCLILVDSPKKGRFGGSSAAPIFKNIAAKMIESDNSLAPDKKEIKRNDSFIKTYFAEASQSDDEISFANLEEDEEASLPKEKIKRTTMPNLVGKSTREVVTLLTEIGIEYKINGSGKVTKQSIEAGSTITKKEKLVLDCGTDQKIKKLRLN